jgi:hypothetical protein
MLIQGSYKGHKAVWLQNAALRAGILPEKGADIFELTYLPNGVQFLMESPRGLQPPTGRAPVDFLENYEGGWQELLPNHNGACEYRGQAMPMHGEVALLPWEMEVVRDDPDETAVRFAVRCRKTPFALERVMRLCGDETSLWIEEKLTNLSDAACDFVWGHHVALGGTFLEAGCELEIPATEIWTLDKPFEPEMAQLVPGQRSQWPYAQGVGGRRIDLRRIPGPEERRHDDAHLTGFARGHYTVTNPRLGLKFSLDWDEKLFPWVMLWQPYGGADVPPLTGIYGVGIEPWAARLPLDQACREGQARRLEGGESLETKLRVQITNR